MQRPFARFLLPLAVLLVSGIYAPADPVVCRVELDKPVLPAGEATHAVVKVTLDAAHVPTGKKRPPINLAVVLDRSGSMGGQKIEDAKEAAIAALRRLDAGDLFTLVVYNGGVETIVPAQPVTEADAIERRIRAIGADGSTNLFGGVNQGACEIRKHLADKRYTPRIILLSDGQANVGPSSPSELGRLGAALVKEGISVTTVGVGNDYNEDLMTQLSQQSDGNTYFAESSEDLPRIFAAELGDVLSVVARKVTIEIECPDGVRPVRIIGRDGRLSGQRAEVFMNQLYGGQSKYVLLEVAVPPTAAAETRQLAMARCVYENAVSNVGGESQGAVSANFTEDRQQVAVQVNKAVQTELAANVNALVTNEVIVLADQGDTKQAVQVLRERSEQLKRDAQAFDNAQLQTQSAELDRQATELEAKGMDRTSRKAMRSSSFQTTNQQQNR
jgi:Ca-activated chloride channel family protein